MTIAQPDTEPRRADIARRLAEVRARVAAAAERGGRDAREVTLVAVGKSFDTEVVAAARDAGQVDLGESRARELAAKAEDEALAGRARWHFVGRLQRNKVADVVGTAALIHSIDRLELAEAVAERARQEGGVQRVLLQVNVAGDDAKAGCSASEAVRLLGRLRELPHLACEGLTTIPAMGADPRPAFAALRGLRDDAASRYPEIRHLSMGMSGDFEIAVEEGATLVRVGEAVFGAREGG